MVPDNREGAAQLVTLKEQVLQVDAVRAARRLLGAWLIDTSSGTPVVARIVETEAYRQDDAASHSFRGPTARTRSMFGPAGVAYVYRSYGMHWCINVSCGQEGEGAAVLLRAAQPLTGAAQMRRRRLPFAAADVQLCRGPGNLARAFGIDAAHNDVNLLAERSTLRLVAAPSVVAAMVRRSPRVGISRAQEKLWRFYVAQNPHVSGPRNGIMLRQTL